MKVAQTTKRLAAAGVAAMSVLAMAGCGGNSAKVDENGKPIVDVQIIKRAAMIPVKDMSDYTARLEKACGCTIKWQEVSEDSWKQQKTAVLAAEDVADLTIWGYSAQDLTKFPLFEDLSDDLDKMPNVKKYFEESEGARRWVTDLDGKIYQIPSQFEGSGASWSGGQFMRINKVWLDKLGLEIPTTWDELTQVLQAFKTQDPNGNGKADEIPFGLRAMGTTGFGWYDNFLLLNSTGLNTQFFNTSGQQSIYVKDGKVGSFMLTDNFRRVIEYYHSLVEQGLVPKDALTKDSSKYNAEVGADTPMVGVSFGWEVSDFGDNIDDYVLMPVPKESADMPDDEVTWEAPIDDVYNGAAVSAAAENKDVIYKIINAMLDQDASVEGYYGKMGKYVKSNGDGTYTVPEETYADSTVQYGLQDRTLTWIRKNSINGVPSDERAAKAGEVYAEQQSNIGENDLMPQWVQPSSEDNTTLSNHNAAIFNYALPKISGWIVNGGLTDASWEEFKTELNNLNLDENVAIWQKWYDKYAEQD